MKQRSGPSTMDGLYLLPHTRMSTTGYSLMFSVVHGNVVPCRKVKGQGQEREGRPVHDRELLQITVQLLRPGQSDLLPLKLGADRVLARGDRSP